MKSTWRVRQWREKNKIRAAYHCLKSHAKERGIEFKLGENYWKEFCNRTNYHILKGIKKHDLTVDRIDPRLGYIEGNIQVLTMNENRRKVFTDAKLLKGDVEDDCPF